MGKFNLFQINSLNEAFENENNKLLLKPNSVFDKNIIVFQNAVVKDLATFNLAKNQKVSANLKFVTLQQLVVCFAQELGVEIQNDSMIWEIYKYLTPENIKDEVVKNYFSADQSNEIDEIKKLQLSKVVADLFDDYFSFKLEENKLIGWQRDIWEKIDKNYFEGYKINKIIESLVAGKKPKTNKLKIVGVEYFTPLQLLFLNHLSKTIEIDCFFVLKNPSVNDSVFKRRASTFNELKKIAVSNNGQVIYSNSTVNNDTALTKLQSTILNATHDKINTDNSIKVVSAYSKKREIEVLYDFILSTLENNNDVNLQDILILTPDVKTYHPYIDAIFTKGDFNYHLKHNITDTSTSFTNSRNNFVAKTFLLQSERLSLKDIAEILESKFIQKKYEISSVNDALNCLSGTNFIFGLGDSKNDENELAYIGWEQSKKRLIYGIFMSAEDYDNVSPFDARSDYKTTLGTIQLVDDLFAWAKENQNPQNFTEWFKIYSKRYHYLFSKINEEEENTEDSVEEKEEQHEQLELWESFIGLSQSETPLASLTFYHILQEKIANFSINRSRKSNGIVVSDLSSSKGLEKKIICIIGLNDGEYPSNEIQYSFDLLKDIYLDNNCNQPLKINPSKKEVQKTEFFSAICNAKKTLFLSYVGKNNQNNKELLPSIFVSELLDQYGLTFNEGFIQKHPANPASTIYNTSNAWVSYHQLALNAQKNNTNDYFKEDLIVEKENNWSNEHANIIYLEDLITFYKDPSKFYLKNILGVNLKETEDLPLTECFDINNLDEWTIRHDAKMQVLENIPFNQKNLKQQLNAPIGGYGTAQINKIVDEIQPALDAVKNYQLQEDKFIEYELDLSTFSTPENPPNTPIGKYKIVAKNLKYFTHNNQNSIPIISHKETEKLNESIGKEITEALLIAAFMQITSGEKVNINVYANNGAVTPYSLIDQKPAIEVWFKNRVSIYTNIKNNPLLFFPKKSYQYRNKSISYMDITKFFDSEDKFNYIDSNEEKFWELIYLKGVINDTEREDKVNKNWEQAKEFWSILK